MPLNLRAISDGDAEAVLDILTDHEIRKTYMLPDFESREAALPLFSHLKELSCAENHYVRAICFQGRLVGFLNDVEINGTSMELGYVIHPDHQGKGYMTEALQAAITDLFQMGYRRIICGAFSNNTPSIRVMEKAGMHRMEKEDEMEYRGRIHRCVYYSIEYRKG